MKKNDKEKPVKEKPKAKEKKAKGKKPVSKARLIARIVSIALALVVVACCAVGDWYVHQPREWLESHRAFYTAPLWYFGYGLSYTNVTYGTPTYTNSTISVSLTNKGKRPTDETVQVYIRKDNDPSGPSRTLRAYKRVAVPAGKSVKAAITLPRTAFEWWDAATNTMRVIPGKYTVMVGPSANPADLKSITVNVK